LVCRRSVFSDHAHERRCALVAASLDSSASGGVRLEPRADCNGHQHESLALRRGRADQRLFDRPVRATKNHAGKPVAVDRRCQRHHCHGSVLAVLSGLGSHRWSRRRRGGLRSYRHGGKSLVRRAARSGVGRSRQRKLDGPAYFSAVFYGHDRLFRLAHRLHGAHCYSCPIIAADFPFHAR